MIHPIRMTYKKSTKNTHVFQNEDSHIPTLYIRKEAFRKLPEEIEVTVIDIEEHLTREELT